jgi:hypothetical protein
MKLLDLVLEVLALRPVSGNLQMQARKFVLQVGNGSNGGDDPLNGNQPSGGSDEQIARGGGIASRGRILFDIQARVHHAWP